ncbi:hypothetical protein BCR41DRAFT_369690 [Lobosporangium transversale]|uniref:Poly(A) RNA polymerase mitochondrial-like central palm domain-containing protein n=1 Tax=Lobosporangium transversale TaxID=64571 RepID=A0A1Y2GR44_9FUNG|nr:hypothetical protein BCR41DRAFT_369690 [Lobosporangium transversale]ORZ20004.1 hypothetical protein BCR41DRAFT_369690 [Lobosporangium transversale]|eukprot:XP_021882544.1 hypothetical protein BCR41DRAFT_369690 [Lobosporangium transversale]
MASGHIPPGLDSDFGGPNRVSGPGHFMHMGRMTPPSEFGHFPMHPVPGGPFQAPFQQQQFHQRQQMFLHQQMLHQQPQQHMQQVHSFQPIPQHPLHHHQGYTQSPLPASSQDVSHSHVPVPTDQRLHASSVEQQDQIKDIESQINKLLFKNDNTANGSSQLDLEAVSQKHLRPLSGVTVQEIEEAQFKDMQNQLRRISLNNPPETQSRMQTQLQPESIPSFPPVIAVDQIQANKGEHETSVGSESSSSFSSLAGVAPVGHRRSNFLETRFKNPSMSGPESSFEPSVEKVPFSVKDIDFYSDRKYDPYRPSAHAFDVITRDAKSLCHNLMPKPEEETRKLALLKRLSEIANEVFDEAEVLPFGSSGNGLALANADMDVCVFLNAKEGEEEVSPVEFVERIGDRLEKDSEFENILQLKRARVPIVKLNHINGIACDIGYQNDLAIWNTRLLRAYCRIDPRLRDIVVVVKTWAKRRKINNPYTGSLSRYVSD